MAGKISAQTLKQLTNIIIKEAMTYLLSHLYVEVMKWIKIY